MIKFLSLSALFLLLGCFSGAQEKLVSRVYLWEEMFETRSLQGNDKSILVGSTPVFSYLEVHAVTLSAGNKITSGADKRSGFEELIIVKEGVVDFILNGTRTVVEEGDVILVCPGDEHVMINNSDKPATWYVFRWKAKSLPPEEIINRKSAIFQWDNLTFIPSENGGRRNVLQRATAQLTELEIHVTTLKAGLPSHAAHTHPDDEFILVKTGNVEMSVSGKPYPAGPGSLYFLCGKDPHGIRNIGNTACEYYAIRMK
jgi:(S)-ureidoglycine aminohydrolase